MQRTKVGPLAVVVIERMLAGIGLDLLNVHALAASLIALDAC